MRVLFIYTLEDVQDSSKPLRSWSSIQFGISYISSVIKADGHETKLLVLGSNNAWAENVMLLRHFMEGFNPLLVCFTAVSSQVLFIKNIARYVRDQWPDKYLIIGGVHATLNPTDVVDNCFNAICIGEGEYPIRELCCQLASNFAPHGIANLWIMLLNGEIEKNLPRPFLRDIDELPIPDRAMWKPWMNEQTGTEVAILIGRGCSFDCTYCCNHAIKKITNGKYVRLRSHDNILSEIAHVSSELPKKSKIYFEIESICLDKEWFFALCHKLSLFNSKFGDPFSYACNLRITSGILDENIFSNMRNAHFYRINIGLEAGSERIRREILNRSYSNNEFLSVTFMARKYGLKIFVFNMIGLPGETHKDYMETVFLNRQCQPDGHHTGIYYPYPGTELHNLCVNRGYLKDKIDYCLERRQAVVNYPGFTSSRIQSAYTWFNYNVYKGYLPLWWVLSQTLITKIFSSKVTNIALRKVLPWTLLRSIRERLARYLMAKNR